MSLTLSRQEEELTMRKTYLRGDQLVRTFSFVNLLIAFALAPFYGTWAMAICVGVPAFVMFLGTSILLPGTFFTRCVAGVVFQTFTALYIYQLHGLAEMHFFFFVGFTLMICYQDWRSMWPGTLMIISQHLLFAILTNSGENLYFFEQPRVGFLKLFFHFTVTSLQVAIAGLWAHRLKQTSLANAANTSLIESAKQLAEQRLLLSQEARREAEEQTRIALQQSVALEEARDHALAADRAKSQFLANMSHEIRTPLNGVIGMTDLLMDSSLNQEQTENVVTLRTSGDLLLRLVNDILDLSKIEAHKLEIESIPFDLKSLVKASCDLFSGTAHEKGVQIVLELPDATPRNVLGDPPRVMQVLNNLISNALKFSDGRNVLVKLIQWDDSTDDLGQFRISVTDYGIGIPESRQLAIFERFTQLDGSTTRKYGGSGLGLTICRHLVELMGGTIGLESKEGVGSTFWIDIAFKLEGKNRTAGNPPVVSADLTLATQEDLIFETSFRVLVAEDNVVNQKVASRFLKRFGIVPDIAWNGKEAVAMLESTPYDLVFMDCQMPVMDGYEATAQIRKHADRRIRATRIVAMTANAMNEDRVLCMNAGMDDYLSKPIDAQLLQDCLSRCIQLASAA
jgi:signal transduction histidine kinase/CheY-like chemotaxis protein